MPNTLPTTSPYATLTASQVTERVSAQLARYAQEDAERAERRAILLAR